MVALQQTAQLFVENISKMYQKYIKFDPFLAQSQQLLPAFVVAIANSVNKRGRSTRADYTFERCYKRATRLRIAQNHITANQNKFNLMSFSSSLNYYSAKIQNKFNFRLAKCFFMRKIVF